MLLPLDVDRPEGQVVLARLLQSELPLFLRLNVLDIPRERLLVQSFDKFLRQSDLQAGQPCFLFHLPFSGSTLLCSMLDYAGMTVFRDPALIDGLYLDDVGMADAELASIGRAALGRFAGTNPDRPAIIRSAGYRASIIRNLAAGPGLGRGALFLYDTWPRFLSQVMKDPKRKADMSLLSQELPSLRVFPPQLRALAAESGVAFWLDMLRLVAELIEKGLHIASMSAETFFSAPIGAAQAIACALGAKPDEPKLTAAARMLLQKHAKSGAIYNESMRKAEAESLREEFQAEIRSLQPFMHTAGAELLLERIVRAQLKPVRGKTKMIEHKKAKSERTHKVTQTPDDIAKKLGGFASAATQTHVRAPLGQRLAALRPVAHALEDPNYSCILRPIDSAWNHAGITSAVGGFNPARHCCYVARKSAMADWLSDPDAYDCPPEQERFLATDVMRFAHDYIHSWCYRVLVELAPESEPRTPTCSETLELQAFMLVLTEAVAVVASDYWYLSLAGLRQRCGTNFDLGPMTVHYRERLLPKYRLAQPELTIREPAFMQRIARLYATGEFDGFNERDLLDNREVADWMIRELLIAPRQRYVARHWLAHLAGLPMDDEGANARFDTLLDRYKPVIDILGRRTWQKLRHGRRDYVPRKADQSQWLLAQDGQVDCRYINLSHLGDRKINWESGGFECWSTYVDQVLSRHILPDDPAACVEIGTRVERIRSEIDQTDLTALMSSLPEVGDTDSAPLEMLFVN